MKLKNKLKRFFTLSRNHDGFTLVELIVVIAIMAILAGVGTVGYGGYIKAANKGADKKLVGDIMRAIETGTNSMAFIPSESLSISATTFPVGFITLSTDGASLLTSGTTVNNVEGTCDLVPLTDVYTAKSSTVTIECERKDTFLTWCSTKKNDVKWEISGPANITYCKTHSNVTILENQSKTYNTSFSTLKHSGHTYTATETPVNGNIIESTNNKLYLAKTSTLCEYAYANQNAIYSGENKVNGTNGNPIDTSHPLYSALYAAFGNLDGLTLKHDGWSADEGIDYATFYSGAPGVMSSMETLSGVLAWASTSSLLGGYVDGEYANGQEVLSGITDKVLTTHDPESWLAAWNAAGSKGYDDYGFGLSGRENYSAARMAYNSGFASYLSANGIDSKYADVCKNYNSIELAGVGLPAMVCTEAFTNDDSGLKKKFEDAGDKDGSQFKKVAELFEKYKNSNACAENGRVFYDTMVTFDETEEFATDKNNVYGGDMFDYYNAYVNEISALYSAAQNAAGGGIIIGITVNNDQLEFAVSPSAANPRND